LNILYFVWFNITFVIDFDILLGCEYAKLAHSHYKTWEAAHCRAMGRAWSPTPPLWM